MADLGQRVVFRQHRDGRALAAPAGDGGPERSFNAADPSFHLEVVLLQEPRQGVGGIIFLVVQFRMGVDVSRQVEQLLLWKLRLSSWNSPRAHLWIPASGLVMIRALLFAEGLDWVGLVCQIGVRDVMRVGAVSPRVRPASAGILQTFAGSVPDSIDGILDCARGEYA